LIDSVSPIKNSAIGTAKTTEKSTPNVEFFIEETNELPNQATGSKMMKVINQPAPKGKGKYSVQNEFRTIFENKN
jgi:hypothetical protein